MKIIGEKAMTDLIKTGRQIIKEATGNRTIVIRPYNLDTEYVDLSLLREKQHRFLNQMTMRLSREPRLNIDDFMQIFNSHFSELLEKKK